MDLQNIKYVFLIVGGCWGPSHDLYAITNDNAVLYTDKFSYPNFENATPEFIFQLEEDLDFLEHSNTNGFDAPDCVMYSVNDGKLQQIYCVGLYDNTPAVDIVTSRHYHLRHEINQNIQTPKRKNFFAKLFKK